jgi:hypothetical protein
MDGLSFATAAAPVESDPARADIACFIGFVAKRGGDATEQRVGLQDALKTLGWSGRDLPADARVIPESVVPAGNSSLSFHRWLGGLGWEAKENGAPFPEKLFTALLRVMLPEAIVDWWSTGDYLNSTDAVPAVDLLELHDVPVPMDSWDVFDAVFAWDARPLGIGSSVQCDTALGAAVRNFFTQGGRKCFVVRLDDPWPVLAPAAARPFGDNAYRLSVPAPSAVDRSSWRGIGHLFALPEVSFLCLPDLPDLFGVTPVAQATKAPPLTPEIFVECSVNEPAPEERTLRGIPSPNCDTEGFGKWASLIEKVGAFLSRSAREVQFVATVPLPINAVALAGQADIPKRIHDASEAQWTQAAGINTAFVQLAYPWLRTPCSSNLPGGVEAPDGVVAGVLANNALTRGSWRSAIRQPIPGLSSVEPVLDRTLLARDLTPGGVSSRIPLTLRDRITVIGPTPDCFRLLSDVTTDDDEAYRPANINRLLNAILRAARHAGAPSVFQNSGPALWNRLRDTLAALLAGLWADGALAGDSAADAFEVRCDRSTMTQADLDQGRVICRVTFTAASPIVHITVVFAMDEAGQVSFSQAKAA